MNKLSKVSAWFNFNWFTGNFGETISSRLGRKIEDDDCTKCRWFCRVVLLPLALLFNQNLKHCRSAIQEEFRIRPAKEQEDYVDEVN